jgi:hypothetical protein
MRVPDFIVRQFYVAGSLRHEDDGFSLQARNALGDGTLVGIRRITIDGRDIDPAAITATRAGEGQVHRAGDVSPQAPVSFRRGDSVTFHVAGHTLAPGTHRFEIEIVERNAGTLTLSLSDSVGDATG